MKKKILIIDDDVVLLNALLAKLTVEQYDVRGAETGRDAKEIIKKWKPDLVILDLVLPDMNGLDMLAEVRETAFGKNLAVIICTNQEGSAIHKSGVALGAKDILLKVHFSLDQLVEKIKAATKD